MQATPTLVDVHKSKLYNLVISFFSLLFCESLTGNEWWDIWRWTEITFHHSLVGKNDERVRQRLCMIHNRRMTKYCNWNSNINDAIPHFFVKSFIVKQFLEVWMLISNSICQSYLSIERSWISWFLILEVLHFRSCLGNMNGN